LSFLVVSPSVSKLREFEKIKAVNTFETASTSKPDSSSSSWPVFDVTCSSAVMKTGRARRELYTDQLCIIFIWPGLAPWRNKRDTSKNLKIGQIFFFFFLSFEIPFQIGCLNV